jgi:hypothetical protein
MAHTSRDPSWLTGPGGAWPPRPPAERSEPSVAARRLPAPPRAVLVPRKRPDLRSIVPLVLPPLPAVATPDGAPAPLAPSGARTPFAWNIVPHEPSRVAPGGAPASRAHAKIRPRYGPQIPTTCRTPGGSPGARQHVQGTKNPHYPQNGRRGPFVLCNNPFMA